MDAHLDRGLEGNTLTLDETDFVLSEGLTIKGKPLKDHRDVEGHARAVDLMYDLVKKDQIGVNDLFNLHKLVIDEQILDVYKPVGDWKNRVARLAANLPCLKSGQPPIVIPPERRYDYLTALADYTLANGVPSLKTPLIHEDACFAAFCSLCQESWRETLSLVEQAQTLQQNRNKKISSLESCAPQ